MLKILETIDVIPYLNWYQSNEQHIVWTQFGHKGKQSGIQYKEGEDPWASAVGRSTGEEYLYSLINQLYTDSIIEKLIQKYKLFRTRLLWVGPYACYSMHVDTTPRIHVPLITNSECYFLFKNDIPKHLELGNIWYVDTTNPHTFINCSNQPRLHLVGAIYNKIY